MAEKTTVADTEALTDSEVTYCSLSLISTKSIKFHQMWIGSHVSHMSVLMSC